MTHNTIPLCQPICHSERSEESKLSGNRNLRFFAALRTTCLLLILSCPAFAQTENPNITSAKKFFNFMQEGKYHDAYIMFDSSVMKMVSEERNAAGWKAMIKKVGAFRQIEKTRDEEIQSYTAVYLTLRFDSAHFDLKAVFNKQGKIAGYSFQAPEEYKIPSYADTTNIIERKMEVKTGNYSMPAIVTLPKKGSNFPIVILVHGSGPGDKDETVENNKPFKDLALGLAAKGIATLRYDKRTYVYGAKSVSDPAKITQKEETVDDAVSALHMAQKFKEIDQKKIFLLGHSQGASCAPRIAKETPFIAGFILMAGPARAFEDVLAEQLAYLIPAQHPKKEADSLLGAMNHEISLIRRGDFSDSTIRFGVPPAYWLDLKTYNQVTMAKSLPEPMLILQGEKDYQVTMKDFNLWKKGLSEKKNVTYISYPGLFHLFFPGEGKFTDYDKAGHVQEKVITDIAEWIKK
jgi:dienelactone hydrolase